MRKVRIVIEAEYELPDRTEIVSIAGEQAIYLAGQTVKPSIEFWQLGSATSNTAKWVSVTEEAYDQVAAGEQHMTVHISFSDAT